jgi:hypothetical protein
MKLPSLFSPSRIRIRTCVCPGKYKLWQVSFRLRLWLDPSKASGNLASGIRGTPLVRKCECGVVADFFEPRALDRFLIDNIDWFKNKSDRAAGVHHSEPNAVRLRAIVRGVIQEKKSDAET